MNIGRFDFYGRVGRIRVPRYLNFGLPLTPESEFGFKVKARRKGDGTTETSVIYLHRGREVPERELDEVVEIARDNWSLHRSMQLLGNQTKIDASGEFPGVAFDYEE